MSPNPDRRHPNIVNLTEIEPVENEKGTRFGYKGKRLGPHVGAQKIGAAAMTSASQGFFSSPSPWVRALIKEQPSVDYYDGEEID